MDGNIWIKVVINLLGLFAVYIRDISGEIRIEVPAAGNCGKDTLLQCYFTGQLGTPIKWTIFSRPFLYNGAVVRPEDAGKYTEKRDQVDQGFVTLVIHNTAITDEAKYGCEIGFEQTGSPEDRDKYLYFECKASTAVLSVTRGKKVNITVDKLYPATPTFIASVKKRNSAVTVPGSRTCSSSTLYSGYYICVWISSNSLDDGSYTYSMVITTVTQADPLTGSFQIVPPQSPAVSNAVKLEDSREVIHCSEGQPLTIKCTSRGGYPAPTVAWYKDSISSSNKMASASSGTTKHDGTYTITLQHKITPPASDDRKKVICMSYYPLADSTHRGSKAKSVILYLTLKPSQPTATQTAVVTTGETLDVSCRTTGSRPAASISWSYQGSTTKGIENTTLDATTETFTVVSLFRRQVTAADNGRSVKCVVTHQALASPPENTASVKLNVRFSVGPSTTRITGNKEMVATGKTTLTLTCTTGSSNPASDITWKNGSVTLTSSSPYTSSSGDNNGVVRSQQLILTPTRYMDGDVITCSVSNIVPQSAVVDSVTLNLKYRPLIKPMSEVIAVEGNNTVLTCVASSKPASTFKWYREGKTSVLHQGTGNLSTNQLTYTIDTVSRTDAATYRCTADNGVETADTKNVLFTVYYPPDVTATATNTTIKASTAVLTCNAKGIPNNNYRYGNWIQIWPGYGIPVSEKLGNEKLELTHLKYEHSGVYTCSASNGVKIFDTNKEFIEGSVLFAVKSFPIITQFHKKTTARLEENATVEIYYYSNAAGSEVNIFRNVNGNRRDGVIFTISEASVEVDLPVFTHMIKTGGLRARILIQIQSKDDFGLYDIVVSNEIDSSTKAFEIIPKGPPSGAYDISVDNIQENSARVSWARGFHGGFGQTFVIQLSTERTNWENVETVYSGMDESEDRMYKDLTDLQNSTTYYVRMYAFNSEGNSSLSKYHYFTTLAVTEVQDNMLVEIAVISGAVISPVIVIVVVVAIVVKVRRNIRAKENRRSEVQTAISFGIEQQQSDVDEQEFSVDRYEYLQHSTESGYTHELYDILNADRETTDGSRSQYENHSQKDSSSPTTQATGHGTFSRSYINLKLQAGKK